MREDVNSGVNEKEGLAVFYLRRSSATNNIKRSFMSFNDLISYFGGLIEIIFGLSGLITVFFNEKLQKISLANKIYKIYVNNQNSENRETDITK